MKLRTELFLLSIDGWICEMSKSDIYYWAKDFIKGTQYYKEKDFIEYIQEQNEILENPDILETIKELKTLLNK